MTQRKYLEGQGGTTRIVERYGKRFDFPMTVQEQARMR